MVNCGTPGVDNSLRGTFMIEVGDFFTQNKIFQQYWPMCSGAQ